MNKIKYRTLKATAITLLWLLAFGAQASIQIGSSITSGQSLDGQFVAGDAVNIVAKSVDITAAQNTYATDTVHQRVASIP